jgi:hypothetical protein
VSECLFLYGGVAAVLTSTSAATQLAVLERLPSQPAGTPPAGEACRLHNYPSCSKAWMFDRGIHPTAQNSGLESKELHNVGA